MQKNSKIKILLTGANGQLGQAFQETIRAHSEMELVALDSKSLDITNAEQVHACCEEHKPNFFINTAAYTKVDLAEDEATEAYSINADALVEISKACNLHNMHLIHFSSDYVYDSIQSRPLIESDLCSPKSVYAASKLQGDHHIMLNCNQYSIFRTSWVYGPGGQNFVNTMLKLGETKSELSIVNDQIGTPTYTIDLAKAVIKLIKLAYPNQSDAYTGLFNYSNMGQTNWADFARKIFDIKGFQTQVNAISTVEYGAKANRPLWSVLSKDKIIAKLDVGINHWEDSLFDYLRKYS